MADVKLSEIGFFLNCSRLTESFDKLKKGKETVFTIANSYASTWFYYASELSSKRLSKNIRKMVVT